MSKAIRIHEPGGPEVLRWEDLVASAEELFEVVVSGAVRVEVHQSYELAEAARAHRDLEARRDTGSSVLLPST